MPQMDRRHGHHARRAAALAVLLLIPGDVLSQAPALSNVVPPMLPLKQIAYIKASNTEAYDHFACGGGNQGHTGTSIALSGDGTTMAVGAPFESGGANGLNGNQKHNLIYPPGAVYVYVPPGGARAQ